ncbi:MAG: RNA polymerase sigma factor [Rhodobacterales bacterium]
MMMPLDAMSEYDDDRLLALYARGDASAARALTARLGPRVFSHAQLLLADRAEAEDVTQEALLRLWRTAPDWRTGEAKVTTWLYRVTANLCTDRLRKQRGTDLDSVPEIADGRPSVEASMHRRARADALQAALMQLPERQRQAVVLRHIEGLANPEIGQIMALGTRAVESLTARGNRSL